MTIDEIRNDFEILEENNPENCNESGNKSKLFILKPVNQWLEEAKSRPAPKMLFGEFWFEGEVCILFADTNLGKSILGVQIAESIAQGKPFELFGNGKPFEVLFAAPEKQKVLYFDFELTDKQFEGRYSEKDGDYYKNHYVFDENLIRAELNPNDIFSDNDNDFEAYLNSEIEKSIIETGAKIIIVDNITYLRNGTEKAKNALPLMKQLKALKNKYNLSILALAHTPKRDLSKPISKNDLQGSKMLINFCDSSFSIGESTKEIDLRYLKQIKVRNSSMRFHTENVQLCRIEKTNNFLHFELDDCGSEQEHLRQLSNGERKELVEKVKELSAESKSQREIAQETGLSLATVNRYLKK